jgi:hypothetical protein
MTNAELLALLKQRMEEKVTDGRTNPIGYGGGDMTGVPMKDADLMRSPCRALKWMSDNSPFEFETYARLTYEKGYQGLIVRNKLTGEIIETVEVVMGGGEDGNPKNQIYINNRKIIIQALRTIQDKLDEGGW